MNYSQYESNALTISDYSPRERGERAINSEWQELALPAIGDRPALLAELSDWENRQFWLKTATAGGRARLFVRANADEVADIVAVLNSVRVESEMDRLLADVPDEEYAIAYSYWQGVEQKLFDFLAEVARGAWWTKDWTLREYADSRIN